MPSYLPSRIAGTVTYVFGFAVFTIGARSRGGPLPLVAGGSLGFAEGGAGVVSGGALEAGTQLTASLPSDRVVLGQTMVGEDQTFHVRFTVPASVSVGTHVLVLEGTGIDGQAVMFALGVAVTRTGANVITPTNGSAISSGGYFGVTVNVTGARIGDAAYLTVANRAIAKATINDAGQARFDRIRATTASYAVRLGNTVTSTPFRLAVKPFGITRVKRTGTRLTLTVATGNWATGTPILLMRDTATATLMNVRKRGIPLTFVVTAKPGTYQVKVATDQGSAFGLRSGVTAIQ